MDPTEEEEVASGLRVKREGVGVDPVVDRRQVIQARIAVGIADCDVGAAIVVALVHRQDPRRREPVDRREDRRLDQAAVRQRKEVEAVVDDVELVCPLEDVRYVQALADLGLCLRILRIRSRHDRGEAARRPGVASRKQRHVDPALDQALGEERRELFPRTVVARRHPPRDRSEHGHAQPVDPQRRSLPARRHRDPGGAFNAAGSGMGFAAIAIRGYCQVSARFPTAPSSSARGLRGRSGLANGPTRAPCSNGRLANVR